jgi:archaetidylinositol phosphate synthase
MSTNNEFKSAKRANTSVLANLERRALLWIAQRLPARVNSDHLTILGFVSLLATGALYWHARTNRWAVLPAIVALALNWFGDSLDGTLARVRNRQRPRYGFYVDHVLDAVGTFFLMSGLALSGFMAPTVAYAFLIAYGASGPPSFVFCSQSGACLRCGGRTPRLAGETICCSTSGSRWEPPGWS